MDVTTYRDSACLLGLMCNLQNKGDPGLRMRAHHSDGIPTLGLVHSYVTPYNSPYARVGEFP